MALGLVTIVLVYLLTREWYGETAARWAAALLAFNEYVLTLSARATAHVPHFFFVAVAVFAFGRFLARQRPGYLYAAAAALGLAFYVKEHSALLVPVVFAALLITPNVAEPNADPGAPNGGVLVTLKASIRNCTVTLSTGRKSL